MGKKIDKWINLDCLPVKKGIGVYKNKLLIDWENVYGNCIKFKYDTICGEMTLLSYIKKNNTIDVLYNGTVYTLRTYNLLNCSLGKILGVITNEYRYNINDIVECKYSNIQILDKTEKNNGKDKNGCERTRKGYKYKCLTCGYESNISETELLNGKCCSVCRPNGDKVLKGYNDIATTHPHLIKYFKNIEDTYAYSKGSVQKVLSVCPYCKNEKFITIYDLVGNKMSCNKCGDGYSTPNKFMFNLLEQLNLEFIPEYSPKWIGLKKYDFYIPSMNLIIEMDGGFHKEDNPMSGQTKEESEYIDNYKDSMAKERGIKIIRIDCDYKCATDRFEYIKQNVLNSELICYFNLPRINWNSVREFSFGSRVKESCDLWNSGIKSTVDIGKIMKINANTIREYLKQGTKLGICDYKVKDSNRGKGSSGFVQFDLQGNVLKIYKNMKEILETNSNIRKENVYSCCSKKSYSHYGYMWAYIEDYNNGYIPKNKTNMKVINLDTLEIFDSAIEANKKYNTRKVWDVCRGDRKVTGGCRWMYLDEYNLYKTNKQELSQERIDYIENYKHQSMSENYNENIICIETKQVFNSATSCCKQSKEVFGIYLSREEILKVCRGQTDSHKGYHFMYYNDYLKQQGQQEELNNQSQDNNQTQETNQENIAI